MTTQEAVAYWITSDLHLNAETRFLRATAVPKITRGALFLEAWRGSLRLNSGEASSPDSSKRFENAQLYRVECKRFIDPSATIGEQGLSSGEVLVLIPEFRSEDSEMFRDIIEMQYYPGRIDEGLTSSNTTKTWKELGELIRLSTKHAPLKHTILFLAANPIRTHSLELDREAREIQVELERAGQRDQFELVTRWAAQPLDLLRELVKLKPSVVHFSGHGTFDGLGSQQPGSGRLRDVGRGGGVEQRFTLFFHGEDGTAREVSAEALADTFGAAGSSVKLVVLNACYSEAQAEGLLAHVDCVVGMDGSIHDDASRAFSVGFYCGLANQQSVADAYKQGRAAISLAYKQGRTAISLETLPDKQRPQLKVRKDFDATRLVLATDFQK